MGGILSKQGIKPQLREYLAAIETAMSGDIVIEIMTADVAPAPTAAIWSYTVSFRLVDTNGRLHSWYTGTIDATVGDTSTAGTAAVDSATPAVVNGVGTVVLSGDAAAWLDTEAATVTLDGTVFSVATAAKVFTVTFTAP